jgi:alkanesulfonate monooxygenase SsuD/methylene tetrahydromethanopterin reductase-like flavin-dependent oxidoreductase (luciferase family)
MTVRLGVVMLPTDPWPQAVARARHLESLGFAHLWTYDHLSWRRFHDSAWFGAVPWLTGMAMATSTIRLGTMVASPNFRHPVTFAKEVMTLDHVSDGRLTVGIGAGGMGYDATVLGGEPLTPGQRLQRLADFLEVFEELLTTGRATRRTATFTVSDARALPGCVQQPRVPLAVAAAGPRALALAARYGDAWITFGDPASGPEDTAADRIAAQRQAAQLDVACAEIGRDPASIDRIFLAGPSQHRATRSVSDARELAEWCAASGFTDLVLHDPRPGDGELDGDPAVLDDIAQSWRQQRIRARR